MRRLIALAVVTLLVSCSPSPKTEPRAGESSPAVSASPTSEARGITTPDKLLIQNETFGGSKRASTQAIRDLRSARIWHKLTDHLYAVKFTSRLGRDNVPDDGHLADALLTVQIDGDVGGGLCDVMFFPTAMRDDLDRWSSYYDQGLLDDPDPSWRQFWASIMAHELAHCLDPPNGEPVALDWEDRALTAVRDAGIP